MPDLQRPNPPDDTSSSHFGSQYYVGDNGSREVYNQDFYRGNQHGSYLGHSTQPNSYHPNTYQSSQSPVNHGMRIRGTAGTETGLRIQGAAGRDQPLHTSSPRPEAQVAYDSAHPNIPSEAWSRSSTRADSRSTGEWQALNSNPIDQMSVLQRKEEQIKEQQKFINRLTVEKQALGGKVSNLTEANSRLSRQLEGKDKELQRLESRDTELLRHRDEVIADQIKHLDHSNLYVKDLLAQIHKLGELPVPPSGGDFGPSFWAEDLQIMEAAKDGVASGDDLNVLDFPDLSFQTADWITPVERRVQPLGATMTENDLMDSQQQVVVSKYLRNVKESEKSSWSRPVEQSAYWPKVKDDPAFALRVGSGSTVTFEMLHERLQHVASTHTIYGDTQDWPPVQDQGADQWPQPQYPIERHLSNQREIRLAALGVSGDPGPVRHYVPKEASARSRSRSPEHKGQQDPSRGYRQRGYETHRSDRQSTENSGDSPLPDDDVVALETAMDSETARNIEAKFGHGQQKQKKRKGRRGKGKNMQNQQYQQQNKQQNQQGSARPSNQPHRHMSKLQSPTSANSHPGSGVFQGRHDQRRNGTKCRKGPRGSPTFIECTT